MTPNDDEPDYFCTLWGDAGGERKSDPPTAILVALVLTIAIIAVITVLFVTRYY